MQTIVVLVIVLGAAFLLGRTFLRSAREGTCPGGCGGCSQSKGCSARIPDTSSSTKEPEEEK
jgi:hypothetical protein